ncbi:hypothetical protein [Corallococcus sp. CA053C]|uniref:hypothetical protein n=1 Tax=Corallococcus sp. CA053C TaxID=2316732 RepID=UPI0011C3F0C1|nr:hypothetical protein [Corallococcus sp. CA053C]
MKLPLMATLTALLLGGCAHQGASGTADNPKGTGGSGSTSQDPESGAGTRDPFSSDEFSWDVEESPRTQAMLRAHGMNPYGDAGAKAAAEAEDTGTGGSGSANPDDYQCVDINTLGTGGSGSIDLRAVDDLAPEPGPSQNPGARLDITPPAWNRNKGIGVSPMAPTTGTPPVEGSGGASGR